VSGSQPRLGLGICWCGGPRVGLRGAGQPWALGRNPVGIGGRLVRWGDWGWQSGGVALLNHRLKAGTPCGVRICGVWFPAVSLVPSSTAG
jgi:hypothetical protein